MNYNKAAREMAMVASRIYSGLPKLTDKETEHCTREFIAVLKELSSTPADLFDIILAAHAKMPDKYNPRDLARSIATAITPFCQKTKVPESLWKAWQGVVPDVIDCLYSLRDPIAQGQVIGDAIMTAFAPLCRKPEVPENLEAAINAAVEKAKTDNPPEDEIKAIGFHVGILHGALHIYRAVAPLLRSCSCGGTMVCQLCGKTSYGVYKLTPKQLAPLEEGFTEAKIKQAVADKDKQIGELQEIIDDLTKSIADSRKVPADLEAAVRGAIHDIWRSEHLAPQEHYKDFEQSSDDWQTRLLPYIVAAVAPLLEGRDTVLGVQHDTIFRLSGEVTGLKEYCQYVRSCDVSCRPAPFNVWRKIKQLADEHGQESPDEA